MSAFTSLAGAVFGWVLQTTWRGAVLTALILSAQWLFRRRLSPAWRHALWLLLIARLAVPYSPRAPFSVFNLARIERPPATMDSFNPSAGAVAAPKVPDAHEIFLPDKPAASGPVETGPFAGEGKSDAFARPAGPAIPARPPLDWLTLAAVVWMTGAAWFGLRLFWLNWRFRSRLDGLDEVSDLRALGLLRECASRLGVRRRVRLIETSEVETPALFGLGSKRLLLPAGLPARFSDTDLRHIFLHEMAHLKRGDLELNWLVELLRAVHWFNPVLWFAFARMRSDREMAADAVALAAAGSGGNTEYGETILKILAGLRARTVRPGAVGIAEERTRLAERMRAIAAHGKTSRWTWSAAGVAAALAALGLTDQSVGPRMAGLEASADSGPPSAGLLAASPQTAVTNTATKPKRTPEFLQALQTLRRLKSATFPWEAMICVQTNINPMTTDLLPDLISLVRENPKASWAVWGAMDKYGVWGVLNRQGYGMEYSSEFETYLHAPDLVTRLIGAAGMALMDRESAGPETLRTAIEGLSSPEEGVRMWSGNIIFKMFPGQLRMEKLEFISSLDQGILARMFPREGRPGYGAARSFSQAEIKEAMRTLWANLAGLCRDQLPRAVRDTRGDTWMLDETSWAGTQGRLGRALFEQAQLTAGPDELRRLLAEAADAYRSAMEDYQLERWAPEWGWYEDNLGLTIVLQAKQSDGQEASWLLSEAVEAHRAALDAYHPPAQFPNRRARVVENLHRAEALLQKSRAELVKTRTGSPPTHGPMALAKFVRSPEVEAALKTLRECKSATDPAAWDAESCLQTNIYPGSTELIPDLITVVRENPKAGWHVINVMNQYAVWGVLNRSGFGMEQEREFEDFLRAPELQARLIGAFGMALVDGENAGPETLRAAFEGGLSPVEEERHWAWFVFSHIFRGEFEIEKAGLVSTRADGILVRMFPREGRTGFGPGRKFSEAEFQEAGRTLWADLVASCRDQLKRASRDGSKLPWTWNRGETSWAATQGRLGRALFEQANLTSSPERSRLLTEAADAYRAAMEDRRREASTPEWGWYEDNLGLTLVLQAEQANGFEAVRLLTEAVEAHRSALDAYPQGFPNRRAHVADNLRRAEALLQNATMQLKTSRPAASPLN